MNNLDYITKNIQELILNGKYNEASESYIKLITGLKEDKSPLLAQICYDYALFLFDLNEYELSVSMFQTSYKLGFEKEKTIDFLYGCFILPNQDEFKETYDANIVEYQKNILYSNIPCYDELLIDFIPIAEDKYCIFDKQAKQFVGIIDISKNGISSYNQLYFDDEFSDLIIYGNWNVSKYHDYIVSAKDRLIYYIADNPMKILSFLKLPNIMEQYCSNIIFVESIQFLQSYYHENTATYLPHLYFAPNEKLIEMINQMVETEHSYRLTKEGRNTSNIILTIGIPSYNRGHRALENIRHLMQLPYDSEIEFVLSNNCSIENTAGYDEVEKISDSRINYFKFPDKPGQNINFCQTIDIAKGKYVCLLSDEDLINLSSIHHYLSVLSKNPNISFAKAQTLVYYKNNSGKIYKKGKDAFLQSFLNTNYITGLIFRTDLFHSLNLYSWTANFIYTNYAVRSYPHSSWCAFYSFYGDYLEDNVLLCMEGIAENDAPEIDISNNTKPIMVRTYGTLERRIGQHYGFIDVLNLLSDHLDRESYIETYKLICIRTCQMMTLVKNQYIANGDNWDSIFNDTINTCIDGVLKLNIDLSKKEQDSLAELISSCHEYFSK